MNYQVVENEKHKYIEALEQINVIKNDQDALDWIAICGENRTNRLLLNIGNLSPDFYHLNTGVAGEILLKFSNYRIKVAAISTPELVNQGKFRDMALETNRGSAFRIFYDREQAEKWLTVD